MKIAIIVLLAVITGKAQWATMPYLMPINPIRIGLCHNGKVVIIAGTENNPLDKTSECGLWDVAAGTITVQQLPWDVFCNGGSFLPDGKCMVVGGTTHYDAFYGDPRVDLYDPLTNGFFQVQSMAHGRWYATAITLSDGRVMAFSGLSERGPVNQTVELYTEGVGWSPEYRAPFVPSLYPRMHQLPDGRVLQSGSEPQSRFFDVKTKTWANGPRTAYGLNRTYGNSILLPLTPENQWKARVMILGGGKPNATATTEIFDGARFAPSGNMPSGARVEGLSVLLPDGDVLCVGGSKVDEKAATATLGTDLYDSDAGTWSTVGRNVYPRLYHSVALLLPDGRVALAGSNPVRGVFEPHIEIFSPDYLSRGPRPVITQAPARINSQDAQDDERFIILTPDAKGSALPDIDRVTLVRPGSVTHSFDMDQRLIGLRFKSQSGALNVECPGHNVAPPGFYMLFILNKAGVPSVARFVQI
jgi:hypothetical protein